VNDGLVANPFPLTPALSLGEGEIPSRSDGAESICCVADVFVLVDYFAIH